MLNGVPAASQPLMLLDGIEISYSLANIKSEDIEAIHVLKGASALAAYGEKGRNGVVQIISKKSGLRAKTGPAVAE
ncbi:TonB-dependent Receptor Plug Domain protein [compost metagenome]